MIWRAGMLITADRLNSPEVDAATNSGATAASGWAVNSFLGRRFGGVMYVNLLLQNVSATVSAAAGTENIVGDPTVATLPAGFRPTETVGCAWDNGTVNGQAVIGTDGTISLRTISYNQTLGAGNVRFTSLFIS